MTEKDQEWLGNELGEEGQNRRGTWDHEETFGGDR